MVRFYFKRSAITPRPTLIWNGSASYGPNYGSNKSLLKLRVFNWTESPPCEKKKKTLKKEKHNKCKYEHTRKGIFKLLGKK